MRGLMVLLMGMGLVACGGTPTRPAPVTEASSPAVSIETGETGSAQVRAYQPPAQLAIARPQPARAVQVLMRRAQSQVQVGDLAAAGLSLERALRIEPRNPKLWNRLARVRAAQRRYSEVEQFAAKSNALAADAALRADNWGLIAGARSARGDRAGAAKARTQATTVQ